MKCIRTFHQVTKYRDMLFENEVCLEKGGESSDSYRQRLSTYSSTYDELVLRTTFKNRGSDQSGTFYIDNGNLAISKDFMTKSQAKDLDIINNI